MRILILKKDATGIVFRSNIEHYFIDNVKNNIPGFIAVSVTEIESGVSYDSATSNPDFDPNLASAYNLEIFKSGSFASIFKLEFSKYLVND